MHLEVSPLLLVQAIVPGCSLVVVVMALVLLSIVCVAFFSKINGHWHTGDVLSAFDGSIHSPWFEGIHRGWGNWEMDEGVYTCV